MPDIDRKERIGAELKKYVSQYITELANNQSLITVTRITISSDFKTAIVFLSILPASQEQKAITFLKRHLHEMHRTLEKKTKKRVPYLSVAIDTGEKNRQRIDELIHESRNGINDPKA